MNILDCILKIYNASVKNIIETFKRKKKETETCIGNLSITTFYGLLALVIILAIILPLFFICMYDTTVVDNVFISETSEIATESAAIIDNK
jgi:hypothetical protein|tara:strand:+ start:126 stop:398 length:273 start_codon:yes stop_codon:yes gene_type:complete